VFAPFPAFFWIEHFFFARKSRRKQFSPSFLLIEFSLGRFWPICFSCCSLFIVVVIVMMIMFKACLTGMLQYSAHLHKGLISILEVKFFLFFSLVLLSLLLPLL